MTYTNGGADVDIDLVVHGLNLKLAHMTSELADKDQSDKAQTRMMLETIRKFVGAQLKPLQDEIAKLKARLEEVEKKGVRYRGVYQRSQFYEVGSMVSHDRSVWACIEDAAVNESPGSHPSKWQMALRGDGRDIPRQPTKSGSTGLR